MEQQIRAACRQPRMRSTLYTEVSPERREAAFNAAPLAEVENAAASKRQRSKYLVPVAVAPAVVEPVRLVQDAALYERVVLMAACN